ncbi:tetratricopeptide repeat protein [Trichuris suis]|nr:tetratricopeptide repeat protein [Trichuris suis]
MLYSEAAKKTRTVYTLIRNGQYNEAAQLLNQQLNVDHTNRAALSLLGYCYVQLHNFTGASRCYSQLVLSYPYFERYRQTILFHPYKLMLTTIIAAKSCGHLTVIELNNDMYKLMAAIRYGISDLPNCKVFLNQCSNGDKDSEVNWGCICFKEENFETALQHFLTTAKCGGTTLDLLYNLAVCFYKLRQYNIAMRYIEEISERHAAEFLQPNTRFAAGGTEIRHAGNQWMLQQPALIAASNLKAAIEFKLKNYSNAAQAMANMPPRDETELDVITLHNEALVRMANEPMEGFAKLQFLCGQTRFPPEALVNLLFVCCKYGFQDIASDVMAENSDLLSSYLSQVCFHELITAITARCHAIHLFWLPSNQAHACVKQVVCCDVKSTLPSLTLELHILKYEHDFIAAIVMQPQSPEESLSKIEALVQQQGDILQRLAKQVSAAQQDNDEDVISKMNEAYSEALQLYLPVLMEQAKMYWDRKDYKQVEKIFQQSVDFCGNYDLWKLNILDSSAIVLANLCVCYILMNQNEAAEELMRKVEKEEDKLLLADPDQRLFHLCIINLVIGHEMRQCAPLKDKV